MVGVWGLAHMVFWTPVYAWIFTHRKDDAATAYLAKFVTFYLVMAGISLLIDIIDVSRYLLGETGSMI